MKVLFAVNDENISTSIVKKYQKQYKEIISYKNVYYFNAILKELQKNKSYDRVIISEDLEEFTSSSFAQKDKFIFDRLDSITDEAVSQDGNDIPIILICSERRNKSEDILVKMFGIGIYNAIIGDDRSIDEVCRLINKPRSKKEAKTYYKIDSDNVNYERESESEVSEMEMQNILMHFKKLGKNEDKYVESFKNIVSQYNNDQLKVIISILPNNVKEVLAERSPEYQKIAFPGGKRIQSSSSNATSNKKKTKEKLLDSDKNVRLSKPVVVPTTMESNMYKKVNSKKEIDIDLDELEDEFDDIPELEPIDTKPKKRGRPRKNPVPEVENETLDAKPKKRGRPRKVAIEEPVEDVLPGFEDDFDDSDLPEIKGDHIEYVSDNFDDDNYDDTSILPGFEDNDDDVNNDDNYYDDNNVNNYNDTPGFEEEDDDDLNNDDDYDDYNDVNNYNNSSRFEEDVDNDNAVNNNYSLNRRYSNERDNSQHNNYVEQYKFDFNEEEFDSLLSGDKKIVSFVGTSKNGTSFIINNIAHILSSLGIDTAILDTTKNKNSYYIYTKNDEDLRKVAINSIPGLLEGQAEGVKVNSKLTVYTNIPNQDEELNNPYKIMETLLRNHSLVLMDCDFETPYEYFAKSQELYLVQSMDVLTIQPLTSFLRDLKVKNILEENKIRIILNKLLRVKGINGKNIIGGMSNYNDPEMSFMTELFDRNLVKVSAQIPFDEDAYAKYLESLVECEIKINGYPKEFKQRLNNLAEVIYPLLPNKNKNTNKKQNKDKSNGYTNSFSSDMNNTLDNMRKRY